MVRLHDPEIDPEAVLSNSNAAEDASVVDEEGDEDANDTGILDRSRREFGKSLMRQCYELLEEMGAEGISQMELGKKMGTK